jgi:hypothetical protein
VSDRKQKNPTLTEYVLVALGASLVGVMAVPERAAAPELLEGAAIARQVQLGAEELRSAVLAYADDHGIPAGYGPVHPSVGAVGPPSAIALKRQLVMASDRRGETGPPGFQHWTFGPYLDYGMPENPVNGLDTVRVLWPTEPFPDEADGSTGWIYQPLSAEFRPNCMGQIAGTEFSYYDL